MTANQPMNEWVQIVPTSHWEPARAELPAAVVRINPDPAPAPRVHLPKGWEAQCREEYDLYVMYRYLAAEEATSGYFLNQRGAAAGLTNWAMFGRPWVQVRGYAGEELARWVAENGETMTATDFRAQYRAGVEVMV